MKSNKLSIIASVYNEEEALPFFYKELINEIDLLNICYQIIFVNDGSTDKSFDILKGFVEGNSNVRVLNFSRNFGHEAAMLAGIDHAKSEAIICMDGDLQHPPRLIGLMMEAFENGSHIVNMVRSEREDGGFLKNFSSKLFYGILNRMTKIQIEPNASDFFLISSRIAEIIKNDYREQTRFLRGIIQIVGFPKTNIEFSAQERIAGKSKYSFFKLLVFSFSAISVLSKAPLRIGIFTGLLFAIFSIIVGVYSFIMKFLQQPTPGYTTLVILMSAMFSIQFFVLGILGDYIGYIFDEVKKRPHYIVMDDIQNQTILKE
jgi:polyisoprenyl-phosphate glycosyltransferase